ncbi:MAG: hypothetical protein HQK54_17180 [Oligoflexales bacterium]|nr:hypothetical protein [Oligoflexales bacterium]
MRSGKRTLAQAILLMLVILAAGCVSLQSVSLTSIPENRQKEVKAKVEKIVILGINFNNDFVDTLSSNLASQCVGGQIRGILTKDYVTDYFLMIVYRRTVEAKGFCEEE